MTTEEPRPSSPFARRGFVTAAIVVAVIVALGIFVLIATLLSPPSGPPASTPPSGPGPSAADESVCGLEGFETTSSLDEAPDVKWELVGTVAAPTDPTIGPGVVNDDGFRSCYAHTAQGALYFAVNFLALGSDSTLSSRLIELVAEGPGKDFLEQAIQDSPGTGVSNYRAQIAGFKIGQYDGKSATIDLAANYNDGRIVSIPLKLVWEHGDWKMVFDSNGQLPLSPVQLQNLGGYIPWSGA
ncbi:MAG: hypothetical protein KF727_15020 [Microbacteriaceae bacterium]|nr:hypothetical protein [Microbacteriaceae bacterium]